MLGELGADLEVRRYFKEKPAEPEIRELAALAPGGVRSLVSTKGARYKQLGLADRDLSDDDWVALLAAEPGLWRRPIAVQAGRVVIGYDREALAGLVQ